jgi:NAD(P)H-quinone oxidoreductase subunit 5
VWIVYRVCDAALMLAAILMHEINGAGDFDHINGAHAWPEHDPLLIGPHFALLGVLFVIAAAGKSALVPFSGWLPRAMEGPTPSSAVFYGALSVHLGVFLLLRISPVLDSAPWLAVLVVVLGVVTAAFGYLAGRVQTDIKSALTFASLTQVGIIIAEIGLGFRYLPLIHLLGHACLRTLQFLRAPSLLHDHHQLEDAIGARPRAEKPQWEQRLPAGAQRWLYRFSLERGYLDSLLERFVARPFMAVFGGLDRLEQRWARLLEGGAPSAPEERRAGENRPS